MNPPLVTRPDALLQVVVASGDDLDCRSISVVERMMEPFRISATVLAGGPLDTSTILGVEAGVRIRTEGPLGNPVWRSFTGVCTEIELRRIDDRGVATYHLVIESALALLRHRRGYRICQYDSEIDIALTVLRSWRIEPVVRLDLAAYKIRKYRVQYGETDFAFLRRMLEDAGVTLFIEEDEDGQSRIVLTDRPTAAPPRSDAVPFGSANDHRELFAEDLRLVQRVRPGRYTLRDHDYRRPADADLLASAVTEGAGENETRLERYHYVPGSFLFGVAGGDDTTVSDARGKVRTDEGEGARLARMRLEAKRAQQKAFTFATNAFDLAPGRVVHLTGHPRRDLGIDNSLLVVETTLEASAEGTWRHQVRAIPTDRPFRPPLTTPKPRAVGVESAMVVGRAGQEIHVDEFGRVRVHFHWDRQSLRDENSSCLVHVSQPWAGTGFGGVNLPRVGQEVIVDYLGGDPDRPMVTGRYYTAENPVPYKLPQNKTMTGWKSNSTGGGGGHNQISMEDAGGSEVLAMRAQKDLTTVVKNNQDIRVFGSRGVTVLGNDAKHIGVSQVIRVGGPQSTTVNGPAYLKAGEQITYVSAEANTLIKATTYLSGEAKSTGFQGECSLHVEATDVITIDVGGSTIKILPDMIEIAGPLVLLNPSQGV